MTNGYSELEATFFCNRFMQNKAKIEFDSMEFRKRNERKREKSSKRNKSSMQRNMNDNGHTSVFSFFLSFFKIYRAYTSSLKYELRADLTTIFT